jgi:transposase
MRKPQLLELTKLVSTEKLHLVDDIIKENGHDALHLHPYRPDLNPIELVWGDIRNRVAQECMSTNLKENVLRKRILEVV